MTTKCPDCGSNDIFLYRGGVFGKYECNHCGYVGALIIEDVKKSEVVKKTKNSKKLSRGTEELDWIRIIKNVLSLTLNISVILFIASFFIFPFHIVAKYGFKFILFLIVLFVINLLFDFFLAKDSNKRKEGKLKSWKHNK